MRARMKHDLMYQFCRHLGIQYAIYGIQLCVYYRYELFAIVVLVILYYELINAVSNETELKISQ